MEKRWSSTKCCSCRYQAQRPSPISTSKGVPTKARKEGLKPIIENLREQGLLIPCNSPCNTPILCVKKSNNKWRLVQVLQIIKEAVVPFTHTLKINGFFLLIGPGRHFTEWIEAFPYCNEQAKEVIKILIHEIVPRFGLPQSLQINNGSAFKAAGTKGVSKVLGIEYHLHCSWTPQSSGEVEKANDIIKRHLHKLTQETQDNWLKVLPIDLMRARTAPQKEGLSPFECIYGRPFLLTEIVIDPEALE